MIDGNYDIIMKTPLGPKAGILSVKTKNGAIGGTLDILGSINTFSNGTICETRCSFIGEIQTAIQRVVCRVEGVFENDAFHAVAKTDKGDMIITGTRKATNTIKNEK